MSLPTTKQAQPSIRSFFQSSAPKYAPPPSSSRPPTTASQAPPPPPSVPPPPAAQSSVQPGAEVLRSPPQTDLPPPPPSLPTEASIAPVTEESVAPLRRINALLLPVSYQNDFYTRAADPAQNSRYSRVISYAHAGEPAQVVGGIICRLVDSTSLPGKRDLYISSLCVLSPYRGLGLVAAALDHIVATAALDLGEDVGVVTAHVWTGHEDSLGWYERRGFVRQGPPIEGYYMKLRPASAWIVRREITTNVMNALPTSNGIPRPQSSAVRPSTTAAVVNLARPGPPKADGATDGPPRSGSYQNQRPEMEWNDLPADMAPGLLVPPKKANGSGTSSAASSRSSSTARKKRDRSYPAAAFGNGP